jgi:hypothetical protein
MGELSDLQVDEDIAAEKAVVEDEIDEEVVSVEEARVELTLEFSDSPILLGSFDLVEATLSGVFNTEKEDIMRPTQGK